MTRTNLAFVTAALLAGCAHRPATTTQAATIPGAAYDLTYETIACWFGPLWGDAVGEPVEQRKANTEARCRGVVARVWNGGDVKGDVERLRALEESAVAQVLERVDQLARGSVPEKERHDLVALLKVTAGAQRDNLWARRAADRIRLDEERHRTHDRISDDERAALDPLLKTGSLHALLTLDAGRFTADAHAVGVLSTMDRINVARGLPRHLEVFAAEPAFSLLFQVPPPAVPSDPSAPIPPHVWIDYLVQAASNAGHPVPSTAARAIDRDLLGWSGMLEGIADQLANLEPQLSEHLKPAAGGVVRRLQAQAIGDRNRFAYLEQLRKLVEDDRSGGKERGMANCPSAVPGAWTRAEPLADGVVLEVTADDPAGVAEIRARARRQTEVVHHPLDLPPHTGIGSDTGRTGYCPVVLVDTTVSAEDLPRGARLTVRAKDKQQVEAVQKMTEDRIEALRRTGP